MEGVVKELRPYRLNLEEDLTRHQRGLGELHFRAGGQKRLVDPENDFWEEVPRFYTLFGSSLGFRCLAQWMFSIDPKPGTFLVFDSEQKSIRQGEGGFSVAVPSEDRDVHQLALELTEQGNWCGINRGDFVRRLSWETCPRCLDMPEAAKAELIESGGDALVYRLNWDAWLFTFTWFCWLDFRKDQVTVADVCYTDFEHFMAYPPEDDDWEDGDRPNLRITLWPTKDWGADGKPNH